MEKLNVNELNKELMGTETIIDFCDFDSFMAMNGYYSVFDDGITEAIKRDKNIVYTAEDTCECEVHVFFEIVTDNEPDEAEENFTLRITGIQNF